MSILCPLVASTVIDAQRPMRSPSGVRNPREVNHGSTCNLATSAEKFVNGVNRAIEWTRSTPLPQVRARLEQIVTQRKRNEDASLVRYWRSSSSALPGGLFADDQFQIWIDWLVRAKQLTRGQVRASDVYTNRFNPLARPALR
jgi:hypothetical protein